jgi:hypothetical protein
MSYVKDHRVDAYLNGLPGWQREICSQVRDLVHAADPDVEETIKRRVQPYFVLDGNICALLAAKDHVNVFLYDGAIVPDPEGIITAGHDNKTARTVAFRGREDQRTCPDGDVQTDHRQQSGWRLAQAKGRLIASHRLTLGVRDTPRDGLSSPAGAGRRRRGRRVGREA